MKYSKKLILSVAAVTIGLGVGSVAVMNLGTVTAANKDPRLEAPLVQIAEVRPSSKAERAFTGLISARVQSNLGFRVNGKVTNRYVDAGQRVEAGQPLMRIDQKDLDLTLTAKENAVLGARAVAIQAAADEARYSKLVANGWAPQQR
jgi:multidrug efflux pump subunit AcrA (membrane-fusion protein)